MAIDLGPFTQFVNAEVPKRLSTEVDATKVVAGLVPLSTGTGLDFELVPADELGSGPEGKSAYELAVAEGFVGTVEEWLISLKADISLVDLKVGIVTHSGLLLSPEGTVTLPQPAYGDIMLNTVIVHLKDDSIVEVTGVTLEGLTLSLNQEDFLELKEDAVSITVSYLGDL